MLTVTKLHKYYKVDAQGCWIWQGPLHNGYGRFNGEAATRRVYRMFNGDFSAGLYVLHKCDVAACINPEHLFLGTQKDNLQDMAKKGRHGRSKLTAETAKQIKGLLHSIRPGVSDYYTANLLGELFKVSRGAIESIRDNRSWTHA